MAKRYSYRAYRPGSVEQQIKTQLTSAVSALRKGKKGCTTAKRHAQSAVTTLAHHMGNLAALERYMGTVSKRTALRQTMRIARIAGLIERKCGRL